MPVQALTLLDRQICRSALSDTSAAVEIAEVGASRTSWAQVGERFGKSSGVIVASRWRQRVVGATFVTDRRQFEIFEPEMAKLMTSLSRALPLPGYLMLLPGVEEPRGLPAIVLPHGGPSARDAWFQQNGFRSWRTAIGDVLAAGRWLVKQGMADPMRLGVVGWSYGGYAALQSAVVDPAVFKAVVAIAPVTDLEALLDEARNWSHHRVTRAFVGDGPYMREGSPIEHAGSFKVPVLLFHGTLDRNVGYWQSQRMAERLNSSGTQVELVTFDGLDHHLYDSGARAEMLRRSDEFLHTRLPLKRHGADVARPS